MRAGTTGDYAPFSVKDAAGVFRGFDVELVQALAQKLAKPVTFAQVRWTDLPRFVDEGGAPVDVIASGVTITAERQRHGRFTRPYLKNRTVVMGRNLGPTLGQKETLSGRLLGVNRGGYLEGIARSRFPDAIIRPVDKNEQLAAFLERGSFDFFMSDALEADKFMASHQVRVVLTLEAQEHALYVPMSGGELVHKLDTALATLLQSGVVTQLAQKHGIDRSLVPPG